MHKCVIYTVVILGVKQTPCIQQNIYFYVKPGKQQIVLCRHHIVETNFLWDDSRFVVIPMKLFNDLFSTLL